MSKNKANMKFFRSDPVPIKNSKILGNNTNFLVKGHQNDTFELKKGESNVYIITTSDNKRLEFDRNSLLDTLKDLKRYSHSPIKILEVEQKDSFTKVMNAIGMLYKTGKLYELVHNDIKNIFDDVKIVIPGTIAAYFIGCSSNDNFAGPMGCNPKCAASLAPEGKDPSEYTCDDLVLMYENDRTFSSLNQKISQHTYIHIGDINFKGFTQDNIKQLTDAHISSVTLIYGKADGTYGDPVSPIAVNKLPLISDTESITNSNNNNRESLWWFILILIIIIIIIILLIMFYRISNNRNVSD